MPDPDAGGDNGEYFLGAMLFIERERPQPPSRLKPWQRPQMRSLEVVDGLQRLTTLTILLCILRDLDRAEPPNTRVQAAIGGALGAKRAAAAVDRRARTRPSSSTHVRAPGATRVEPERTEPLAVAGAHRATCATTSSRP